MKSLIVGMGEIGSALYKVLDQYKPAGLDPEKGFVVPEQEFDIMHICFGYSTDFINQVKEYQEKYKPKFTVIHSTVPPETSGQLNAIHSPVIGIHPFIEDGLRTFTKFLAGNKADQVADYFRRAGLKVYIVDEAKATELMKILDTSFYALCIEYTKDVKRQCKKWGIPFELWTIWTNNYNSGYQELGYPEFTRPNLIPILKPQGGHCTIPNLSLVDTAFAKVIKELNQL